MTATPSIYLVGLMGAGKTVIGRRLARRLGRPFWDSDRVLEERTGVDIPTIFEYEGEPGFRRRESVVIDELTRLSDIVLASGGGAVLAPCNRGWLCARGAVVYLHASVEVLFERTGRDRNRPLLQTPDPRARLEALLAERDPLYREIADLVIDTDGMRPQGMVSDIIAGIARGDTDDS